jgi:Arc/MetJ-type ribon-helix-helix transcriptional regulator
MSKQIAMRLPDATVDFLDRAIAQGSAKSRTELVQRALKREELRQMAEQDARIYAADRTAGIHDDMDDLAAWMSTHRPPIED